MLSDFGVDYIELTSPVSSPQSFEDCKTICSLGLKVRTRQAMSLKRILTPGPVQDSHTRPVQHGGCQEGD